MESVTADGAEIPALGFGTARMRGEECLEAVSDALSLGYRHLDTAQMYHNEAAVGEAIAESDVPRDAVFLTTKLRRSNLGRETAVETTEESLDRLDTDYVDLLLIHAPGGPPIEETVEAMNGLQDRGLVGHIGVSNFSVEEVRAAMEASETPIVTNQIEYHPMRDQREHLRFCIENGVALTAYSPLDVGDALDAGTLTEIGEKHEKTAAQVALRWLLQQSMVAAIPKAADHGHRAENLDVFDFSLTDDEVERIFELAIGFDEETRAAIR